MADKLAPRKVEEGALVELDARERLIVLRDDIRKERQAAKAAGLSWTPWRKRRVGEAMKWCSDGYHRRNKKKMMPGIFITYSTEHHTFMGLCERCYEKNKGLDPNFIGVTWFNSSWWFLEDT